MKKTLFVFFIFTINLLPGKAITFSNQYLFFRYGLHDEHIHLHEITRYNNTLSDVNLGTLTPETQLELAHHQFEVYIANGDSIIDYSYRYRYYKQSEAPPAWRSLEPYYFGQYIHDSGFWYAVWALNGEILLKLPLDSGDYYLEFNHQVRVRSAAGDTITAYYESPDGLPYRCQFSVYRQEERNFADSMRSFICLDSPLQGYPDTLILWDRGSGDASEGYFHMNEHYCLQEGIPVYLENIVCRMTVPADTCTYFYRIYAACVQDTPSYTALPMSAESELKRRADNLQIDLVFQRSPGNYILEIFGCISNYSGIWTDQLDWTEDNKAYMLPFCIIDQDSAGTEEAMPVRLVSFSAEYANDGVNLSWETASETENRAFRIYRNGHMITEIRGAGSSSKANFYSFTDWSLIPGKTYEYMLADVSLDNTEHRYVNMTQTIYIPESETPCFAGRVHPNPFNPCTQLPLFFHRKTKVTVMIYDICGRPLSLLLEEELPKGPFSLNIHAKNLCLSTGIYFLQIRAGNSTIIRKIAYIK